MSGVKKKIAVASVFVIACAVLIYVLNLQPTIPVDSQLRNLRRHFQRSEHAEVVNLGEQLLAKNALTDRAAIMSGESATRLGELEHAATFYETVETSSTQYATAQFALAEVQRELGRISQAEATYKNVLLRVPEDHTTLSRLALLMMVSGRTSDAVPYLRKLLTLQEISWTELCWLAAPDHGIDALDYLKKCRNAAPSDPAPILGLAHADIDRGHFAEADRLLESINVSSDLTDQRQVLRLQIDLQTSPRVAVPDNATELFNRSLSNGNYEALFLLGAVFEANDQAQNAIHCLARCVQSADHLAAMQHLQTLLATAEPGMNLDPIQRRITILSHLDTVAKSMKSKVVNVEAAREIAGIMGELGRHEESIAWGSVSQQDNAQPVANAAASADISDIIRQCFDRIATLNITGNETIPPALQSKELSPATDIILI
ncbi:MAG: tetratricopeptide repeat protein, partial [Planctomycetota bacterium]|nr:tetratricopeptide repeat protein [Planctomycetota bacterium]